MTILQLTQVPRFMTIARTIMEIFTNLQSLRIQPSSNPVVNVLSKINHKRFITQLFQTYIDIGVLIFIRPRCFTGRLQFLTTAASPAPTQLTKLTQSLRLLSSMISARALRHKSAESYQVHKTNVDTIYNAMKCNVL